MGTHAPLRSHKELDVWKESMKLVQEIYLLSSRLPRSEQFGFRSQLQRAAVSIPANIAEGYGRIHRGEYLHHVSIAAGSAQELDTLLELVKRLGFVESGQVEPVLALNLAVCKMLTRLLQALKR